MQFELIFFYDKKFIKITPLKVTILKYAKISV